MPREPAYRIPAMAQLHRQLRFAPVATLRRQMDAAEALVHELDPDQAYPLDYLVYRLTSYRPDAVDDGGDAPATFVGAAVREDLAVFIQRASERLDLDAVTLDRPALPVEAVARRLGVTIRTLRRYRRDGLYVQRITVDGVRVLGCFEDVLERFESRLAARLERARAFSRLSPGEVDAVVAEARRRAADGVSLNLVAGAIAAARGRAHETIRGVLQRHDANAAEPIFGGRKRPASEVRRFVLRARERGCTIREITGHLSISGSQARRAEWRARADRLRRWSLSFVALPTLELDDADAVILSPPGVQDACGDRETPDALVLAEIAHDRRDRPREVDEDAWLAAYNLLKRRAVKAVAGRRDPSGPVIDRAETDLRWAGCLKRCAVLAALPPGLRAAEQHLARPLPEQPTERLQALAEFVVAIAARIIDTIDPSRGQRLARLVSSETDRALGRHAERELSDRAGGAAARHAAAAPMPNLLAGIAPWARALELRADLLPYVDALAPDLREVVVLAFGLGPGRPLTTEEIAQRRGTSATAIGRRRTRALRALRTLARDA